MYLDDLQEVLDSLDLVDDYHNKQSIKDLVKTRFVYKDNVKPVTSYVSNLVRFSPFFADRWRVLVTQGKELGRRRNWSEDFKQTFQGRLDSFLEECYANQPELRSIKGKAFASYTGKHLSPSDLNRLRQIQSLSPQQQKNALANLLGVAPNQKNQPSQQPDAEISSSPEEEEARNIREIEDDIKETPSLPQTLKAGAHPEVSSESHFGDIGQPLPTTIHPPTDLEVLQAEPETPTQRQATLPISQIRAQAQSMASRGRQILRPLASEAVSSAGVAAIRAQPIKQAGNLGSYFIRQIPLLSPTRRPSGNMSYFGGGYGGRLGRGSARATGIFPKKMAAQTKIWFAIFISIAAFIGIFFFQDVFNPNATLCPPWEGCAKVGSAAGLPDQNGTVVVVKTGDPSVANGVDIHETITVTNISSGRVDLELIDPLPKNATLDESSTDGKNINGTIHWAPFTLNVNQQKEFKFTLRPTDQNTWVMNAATTNIIAVGPPVSIGGSCADTSSNRTNACHYLNAAINIFDTNISQSALDAYINKYSPGFISAGRGTKSDFQARVQEIMDNSKEAGINPAILLGLWRSENNFAVTGRVMGCAGNGFSEEVHCALGIKEFSSPTRNPIANCARSHDANSTACVALKGIRTTFDKTHPINYPIATFDDFMEAHGPYGDPPGGPPNNCINTYNIVFDIAKELGVCNTSSTPTSPTGETLSIGKSVSGKDITGYKIGNGDIKVAIMGGLNGLPEQNGIDSVNQAYNAAKNSQLTIANNLTVYFFPMLNPDSSNANAGVGDFNAHGVDLNRNFDSSSVPGGSWNTLGCSAVRYKTAGGELRFCGDNSGTSTTFPTYCQQIQQAGTNPQFYCAAKTGSSAFSEPETQAIRNFIQQNNISLVLSFRAPYSDVTSSNATTKIAHVDALAGKVASTLGIPYDKYFLNYPVTGQFMDWLQDKNIIGIEVEMAQSPIGNTGLNTKVINAIQQSLNYRSSNFSNF